MANNKDWVGNSATHLKIIGSSHGSQSERVANDFYATDSTTIDGLLKVYSLPHRIWECACGNGSLSKKLESLGYDVVSTVNANGFKGEYFLYTMIGGNNDFAECYSRIHYWWRRLQDFRHNKVGRAVYAYAQPYRDPDKKNTPPHLAVRYGSMGKQANDILHYRFQRFLASQRFPM